MSVITELPTGTYSVDPTHSNVGFEVKHMGIATVRGAFKSFSGTVNDGRLEGSVEVSSIDTGTPDRDGHLQGPEFFDAAQFPQITFKSDKIEAAGEEIKVGGEITIKGVTKPIQLTGTVSENGQDPWGNERVGFEVETVIDRREFGLQWNQTLPNGADLVAWNVKIIVSVSAVKGA
jgi:polyisoprenoid-binding protein YceI